MYITELSDLEFEAFSCDDASLLAFELACPLLERFDMRMASLMGRLESHGASGVSWGDMIEISVDMAVEEKARYLHAIYIEVPT